MPHVDPARLVELALGNDAAHDDVSALQHVAACGPCREELRLMTRVVLAARGVEEADLPTAPPARVWQRIAQGLSEEAAEPTTPPPDGGDSPPSPTPAARDHTRGRSPARDAMALALGLGAGAAVVRYWRRRNR
ncbi:hypothetical protein [Streptomyces parvulus]|uniref:hypothetical protein n=1 Tax=Streptomyces parvulus TaxID=146923 RepID=UPI00382313E4